MTEKYELSKEVVDFLYNGCVAFFPDQFYPEDQKVAPAVFYSGQNKETFEQKLLEATQAESIQDAIQIVRGWKIALDRGEEVYSTVPVNIEDLVTLYEKASGQKKEALPVIPQAKDSSTKAQGKEQPKSSEKTSVKEDTDTTNILETTTPKIPQANTQEQSTSQPNSIKPTESILSKETTAVQKETLNPNILPFQKTPETTIAKTNSSKTLLKRVGSILKREEVEIKKTETKSLETNLYSPLPEPTIKLSKEQLEIVKLAHQDPQNFADQLKERIIETSKLNPENPLETESAEIVAKTFTLKLLNIDPKDPKITIDSSPFETLAFFANPKNEELAKIIPDAKAREEISRISLEALYSLEKDSTIATNFVNQAFGQDWSPFFIPPQIRKLEAAPEGKIPEGGINVNLTEFLEQVVSFQTLEKQIKNAILDEKTYNQLSKPEKARLETEIKKVAGKVSSATRAFSFITGKKLPPPQGQVVTVSTGWLDTQLATIGISTQGQSLPIAISLNFGSFSSPNILSSPILNFAFDKLINKIPAVAKLNTAISGMTAKLGSKVATKIAAKAAATKLGAALAANVIPAIGQVISAITALLSLKDLASLIKVWLKKNQDKLTFILAGILVGAFALTGAPLYLVAGVGVISVSRAASIGTFLGGLFFALTNIVLASLVIPMLIVFIGIPILVAIILFIINSGAYVYPPSTKMASLGPGAVVNEYIEVTKLAYSEKYPEKGKSSELSFENNQLPLEITYEITIKAKKGSLTNISISETCNVTKKNNIPSCPNPNPAIPNGSNIGTIDSASPYTFTYKKTFTSPQFEDTLTIDTITVSATNAEGESVSSAGSASIKIGNPPEECPSGWPIMPEGGETSLRITQGPRGIFSHLLVEAIDIAATTGHSIISTHSGTATVVRTSNAYRPLYIDVESTCNGKTIITRYAHLSASSVSTGQKVIKGQIIGLSGSDGTGPHLHYEFRQNIKMDVPYIPKHVPYGCSNNCGNIP